MTSQTTQKQGGSAGLLDELPVDRLKEEALELGKALARKSVSRIGERLSDAKVGDLGDLAPSPGDLIKAASKVGSPLEPVKQAASKVKDALPGSGSDGGGEGRNGSSATSDDTDLKVTNIVETVDVPVGRDLAYKLWTQFEEFPTFMKKVETVTQKNPQEVTWKAQVFWSHRTWTAKIIDQVPPEHIVWKSDGDKGHVDGAVTFHELAPDLTRVLVSLEYYPQGLFERTGNLWRAQGRRVRLELKHFRRFVANHALLHQDDVDGWLGEIREGKIKRQRGSSTSKKSGSGTSSATKKASGGTTAKKASSSGASSSGSSSSSGESGGSGGSTAKKSTSPARKSTSAGSTAKKSSSSGSTAKKSSSSGSTAKKSSSSGSTAKKSSSSGSTAKKSSSSGSSGSGGSTAKKAASSGSTSRSTAAKKAPAKRTAAAAKRSSTRTSPARSSASKRTSPGSSRPAKATSSRSKSGGSTARKSSSGRSKAGSSRSKS